MSPTPRPSPPWRDGIYPFAPGTRAFHKAPAFDGVGPENSNLHQILSPLRLHATELVSLKFKARLYPVFVLARAGLLRRQLTSSNTRPTHGTFSRMAPQ